MAEKVILQIKTMTTKGVCFLHKVSQSTFNPFIQFKKKKKKKKDKVVNILR